MFFGGGGCNVDGGGGSKGKCGVWCLLVDLWVVMLVARFYVFWNSCFLSVMC